MIKKRCIQTIFVLAVMLVSACTHVPDYVIPPDEMSEILADLYVAEAIADNNYKDFGSDSAKMLLKQSVVQKRGYSLTDLDTSFIWYGANIEMYNKVNDGTISVLENRIAQNGKMAQNATRLNQGDSVMLWDKTSFLIVRPTPPSRFLTFQYDDDDNEWTKGDMFILRAKFTNVEGFPSWSLTAEYDDETFDIASTKLHGAGWQEIALIGDSLKRPVRIYGNLNLDRRVGVMTLDSIQLVKKPLNTTLYSQRYRQKQYDLTGKRNQETKVGEEPEVAESESDS